MFPQGIPEESYVGLLKIISWTGRGEGVYATRFSDALLTAAAAERVAIGSSVLRQKGNWFDPIGNHPESLLPKVTPWPDSLVRKREQLVRAEIRLMSRAEP
jgi:hypothetical protein